VTVADKNDGGCDGGGCGGDDYGGGDDGWERWCCGLWGEIEKQQGR
jgi:hypothetical protein